MAYRERERPARRAALARVTLTLALSHEGRGDPPASIRAWFRGAGLASTVRIPAFAGMTGAKAGMTEERSGNDGGEKRE